MFLASWLNLISRNMASHFFFCFRTALQEPKDDPASPAALSCSG